jgi:adenosylcobinamide hydrolase
MANRKRPSVVTSFVVTSDTLLIDLGEPRPILSSAPRGGGLGRARYILNHQVAPNPLADPVPASRVSREDPARYLGRIATRHGVKTPSVALMTAVPLKQLVVMGEESAGIWVEGFFTVGVSNAVRAGEPIDLHAENRIRSAPGTINIILVTNGRLTSSAMVGVVQVATESKTAVLISHHIPSQTGGPGATGTGTDAIVVASGKGPILRYSGTHTEFGEMVGRLVARGVGEGLLRSKEWARFQHRGSVSPR